MSLDDLERLENREGCQNSDSPPKQSFDSLIYLAMFKLLSLVKQRARAGQTALPVTRRATRKASPITRVTISARLT